MSILGLFAFILALHLNTKVSRIEKHLGIAPIRKEPLLIHGRPFAIICVIGVLSVLAIMAIVYFNLLNQN
jgi:hypothetical protein